MWQSTGQVMPPCSAACSPIISASTPEIEHPPRDTAQGLTGFASVGSRSAMWAGTHSSRRRPDVAKGKKVAFRRIGSVGEPISNTPTRPVFKVVGTDRKISLFDAAKLAKEFGENSRHQRQARDAATFPNGLSHRPKSRSIPTPASFDIVTYTAVDDCGNMLDSRMSRARCKARSQWPRPALTETRFMTRTSGSGSRFVHGLYGKPRGPRRCRIELREATHVVPADQHKLGVQRHRRGRHHGGDRRGDERDLERIPNGRRRSHGNAGDRRQRFGSVSEGLGGK